MATKTPKLTIPEDRIKIKGYALTEDLPEDLGERIAYMRKEKKALAQQIRFLQKKRLRRPIANFIKDQLKVLCFHVLYPQYYRWCARKPISEDTVVFAELMSPHLTASFRSLYKELSEGYDFDIEVLLLNQLRMRYLEKTLLNFKVIKKIATARYVFINNTFPVISACPLRPETKVVQVWHGCGAFKRFGFSLVGTVSGGGEQERRLYRPHAHYTHVFVSGQEAVPAYAEAFGMEDRVERIHPIGVSRTDVFWDADFLANAERRLEELIPAAKGKKVILYAPTYRNNVTYAETPIEFDIDEMRTRFSDEYILIMKFHPFVKYFPEISKKSKEFAYIIDNELSTDELLATADICISDYSSLVFEYALFEKPIIFFVPDLDDYYDVRGFYYEFEDFACGPICRTADELMGTIAHIDEVDLDEVRAFKDTFMDGCDGLATKRILETVFEEALASHKKKGV